MISANSSMPILRNKSEIQAMAAVAQKLSYWMTLACTNLRMFPHCMYKNGWEVEQDFRSFAKNHQCRLPFVNATGEGGSYNYGTCISIDDEIVHSRPTTTPFKTGQLVTIDAGLSCNGWHADMAKTVVIGSLELPPVALACKQALTNAIAQCISGNHVSDISTAIAQTSESFGVVSAFAGHGIGQALHEAPIIPNLPNIGPYPDVLLRSGMVICIEPMFTEGSNQVILDSDRWRVLTADGSRAAHFEHMVAVGEKPQVLTL